MTYANARLARQLKGKSSLISPPCFIILLSFTADSGCQIRGEFHRKLQHKITYKGVCKENNGAMYSRKHINVHASVVYFYYLLQPQDLNRINEYK